ncbi:MAG: amidinotransferase [Flavobacteriales bacterium]|mgnify:CR=1 FL=1|nr:amidinotransferase [Flavobacteriales bacterium]
MIKTYVNNEFSSLKQVILGIPDDFGGCPNLVDAYDPKSKEHIQLNTFPKENAIKKELDQFLNILHKYHVNVLRPKNLKQCNQVFARDIGFVIQDQFFISNVIENRKQEILGLELILNQIPESNLNQIPEQIYVEGGDVVVSEKYIFLGYSEINDFNRFQVSRTNKLALDFISKKFPHKEVVGFQLNKSDDKSLNNCLHLDCCFQPLGLGHVILYPDGFKYKKDLEFIYDIFGEDNIIIISKAEMAQMFSNLFSISKNTVVSEKGFARINQLLIDRGYSVECVQFSEISKMGGLLRCTTLPLIRSYE